MIRVRTAWHAIQMTENDAPVIIEAALNGVTSRAATRTCPRRSEEQAKDALACVDAGATVIHTHAPEHRRSPPEEAAEQYATAFRPVVEQHPGIICYPTDRASARRSRTATATSSCSTTWDSSAPGSSTPAR